MLMTHEISHKKRLIFANKNGFLPSTPQSLQGESGLYIDKIIYGNFINNAPINISAIDESIRHSIIECKQFTEEQAKLVFSVKSKSFGKEITECDNEEYLPLCNNNLYKRKKPKINFIKENS